MYSHDELTTLHGFLKSTGEGNLKKMLVGGRMSEPHLRLLLKIARGFPAADFITNLEADSFPKLKYTPADSAIKEGFWAVCTEACAKVGLLTAAKSAAKKAA